MQCDKCGSTDEVAEFDTGEILCSVCGTEEMIGMIVNNTFDVVTGAISNIYPQIINETWYDIDSLANRVNEILSDALNHTILSSIENGNPCMDDNICKTYLHPDNVKKIVALMWIMYRTKGREND